MIADESEFEQRLRGLLEESVDGLDGRVRSRLTRARYAALEARAGATRTAWRGWAPAGAVAASALVALAVLSNHGRAPLRPTSPATVASTQLQLQPFDDLELLADNDALELSNADDYDFYEWAAAQGPGGETEIGT